MKKTFIIIAAAIVALVSCSKEIETIPETATAIEKFTASIDQEVDTKTKLGDDGLSVLWKTGDAISINGCTYTADNGGVESSFTKSSAKATANASSPKYTAIYPASLADSVLNDVQDYKEGSKFKSMPMYAASNTTNLTFKNICAVLAVTVPSSITTIRSIEISSSNRALSGEFTITSDNVLELKDTSNCDNTMTLECGTGVANPGTFYIAIPAGKYKELKITVCDGPNNYTMTTKSGKYITVERNKMYPISFKAQTTKDNPFRITALEWCRVTLTGCLANNGLDGPDTDAWTKNTIEFKASKDGGKTWMYNTGSDLQVDLNKGESLIIQSVESRSHLIFQEYNPYNPEDPSNCDWFTYIYIEYGNAKVSGEFITLLNRAENDKSASDYSFACLFVDNKKLVSARDLILPDNVGYRSYHSTFSGCTNLKDAPVLPATTLASDCYKNMFYGCSSLNYIKMLATDISASDCMADWVNGVASTGTFIKNPAAIWNTTGTSGVPTGWSTTYDSDDESDTEHEYVDLGLSVKWATCNVGATKPEEYGNYYAWGEIAPKSNCSWSNYKWCSGTYSTLTKYNTSSTYGTVDKKTVLVADDDVATVVWGKDWRMPTWSEWQELYQNCKCQLETRDGIVGCLVTSLKTGYTDKSIFLPAAGYLNGSTYTGVGTNCFYWASTIDSYNSVQANRFNFYSSTVNTSLSQRAFCQSVRPVRK